MKIENANGGILTNFEVLNFLRARGASTDPTRVIAPIAPSEFKVYDYLMESAARDQTKECIAEFMEKSKKYDLAKAELLNIINLRAASDVEINMIVESCEERMDEDQVTELAEMVAEVLPPPPAKPDDGEQMEENEDQDQDQDGDGEQMEES